MNHLTLRVGSQRVGVLVKDHVALVGNELTSSSSTVERDEKVGVVLGELAHRAAR